MKRLSNLIAPLLLIAILAPLALLIAMVVLAYSYTYIVFDSCGYETAKAITRMYTNISGPILFPWQINTMPRNSIVVVLATNISIGLELIKSVDLSQVTLVATDIVGNVDVGNNIINYSDAWLYCIYKDRDALNRIARAVMSVKPSVSTSQASLTPLLVAVVVVGVAASMYRAFEDKLKNFIDKVKRVIPLPILVFLRIKIEKEEALNHPLRRAIYEVITNSGAIKLYDLLKLGSRASIEWHVWILIRTGLVSEVRVGKKRYLIDPANTEQSLKTLIQLDEDVKCIAENSTKRLKELIAICRTDEETINRVLELIRKTQSTATL
uniref:ArsR family transcriptional regulator n=1 Tax=Ignisphaera aggregans TaxID=334771 RepID=A0A7J2U6T5_9CREN